MNLTNWKVTIHATQRGATRNDPVSIRYSIRRPDNVEIVGNVTRTWNTADEMVAQAVNDIPPEDRILEKILDAVVNTDGTIKPGVFANMAGKTYSLIESATQV